MAVIIDTPFRRRLFPTGLSYGYGTCTVIAGYVLNEDGTYLLDEDGNRVVLESGISYLLNEDGTYMLDESGNKILSEDSGDPTLGVATQLSRVSVPIRGIWITANTLNSTTLWISGSTVAANAGVRIYTGTKGQYFPATDLMDLWIIGNINDGISYDYGYITPAASSGDGLQFLGSDLTFGGSDLTFGS